MEETKMEKQNRMLKIILLVLLIPVVSGITILAYHFLVKPSDSDDFASREKNRSSVNRGEPNNDKASPSPTAAATPAIVNVATPTPPAAAPTAKINNPSFPNPVGSSIPFVGKWLMTGGNKTTYFFESPKKIGSSEVGLMRVTTSGGKSYDSNYTDLDRNLSRFVVNGNEYFYEIENNGKTLKLEYDGNILYFDRIN